MNPYEQQDMSNSIDEIAKKMESYFLTTQEEMRQLRSEIAELTRLLKAQRANLAISSNLKAVGAPSISDLLNTKAVES